MRTRDSIAVMLLAFTLTVYADATQTDWSGGPDTLGPVLQWGDDFWESDGIEWDSAWAISCAQVALFYDSYDRSCPDWGTPNIGETYTYINPGSGQFSISSDVGYLDDNSQEYEPWAFSSFTESSNSYTLSFSWKYDAGVHSGLRLYYDDTTVFGIRQDEYADKLRFYDGSTWIDIGDREPGVWKEYKVVVNGDSADVFVEGTLVLQAAIASYHVNKIGFGANGLGTPSDSWFDDVLVSYQSLIFHDSYNRYCADDWGIPDLGDTYTYMNPGSGQFSITSDVGYLDDNSQEYEPWAFSSFTESSNSYTLSFSWKYDAGVHSGLRLYYDDTTVFGIRQDEYADKLRFFDGSAWINIADRDPGVWNDYRVIVNGDSAYVYVNESMVLQTGITVSNVNKIGFGANGLGSPSDSWFDNVSVGSPSILTSSILDTDPPAGNVNWYCILLQGNEPDSTEIIARIRTSDDWNNMGAWSPWLESGDSISTYCSESDRYFQYQVMLTTNDNFESSTLTQFEVHYFSPVNIEDPQMGSGNLLLSPIENPCFSNIAMEVSIPENSWIEISIYDVTGRLLDTPINGELSTGIHEIISDRLMPGLYLVRITTGNECLVRRVMVL